MWVEKNIRFLCILSLCSYFLFQIFFYFVTGVGVFNAIGIRFCYVAAEGSVCSRYKFSEFLLELYIISFSLCLFLELCLYKILKIIKKPIIYQTFLGFSPLNLFVFILLYLKLNFKKYNPEEVSFLLLVPLCFCVVWQFRETLKSDNWLQPSPPQSKESA